MRAGQLVMGGWSEFGGTSGVTENVLDSVWIVVIIGICFDVLCCDRMIRAVR